MNFKKLNEQLEKLQEDRPEYTLIDISNNSIFERQANYEADGWGNAGKWYSKILRAIVPAYDEGRENDVNIQLDVALYDCHGVWVGKDFEAMVSLIELSRSNKLVQNIGKAYQDSRPIKISEYKTFADVINQRIKSMAEGQNYKISDDVLLTQKEVNKLLRENGIFVRYGMTVNESLPNLKLKDTKEYTTNHNWGKTEHIDYILQTDDINVKEEDIIAFLTNLGYDLLCDDKYVEKQDLDTIVLKTKMYN